VQVTRETLYIPGKPALKENGRSEKSDNYRVAAAAAAAITANNISFLITTFSDATAACSFHSLKLLHKSATNGVSKTISMSLKSLVNCILKL